MSDSTFYRDSLATEVFDIEKFKNPPTIYQGAPFWSWNNKLNEEQLMYQIGTLKEMGFGGFHIHSRVGLDTEYLGEEFMHMVKKSVEKGKDLGMYTYLYDEDRFPSGACGGLVTKNHPEWRQKHLMLTCYPYGESPVESVKNAFGVGASRNENGHLLCAYKVYLNADGTLNKYVRMSDEAEIKQAKEADQKDYVIWYAYMEYSMPTAWFNDSPYVDTLNKEAMMHFLETTHEKYYAAVGDEFGKAVKTMFTDEPQFAHKHSFEKAHTVEEGFVPWTVDLPDSFLETYGYDLMEHIPELFWNPDGTSPSLARYHYHDHVSERFTSAFADTVKEWCQSHNILLTGHMMHEEDLLTQTMALGEAMRSYRAFDVPGIDMLQNKHEYHTAKQCQSAVHQYDRDAMMCEIYGVTDWDFTFEGHKSQGDWLAALGVTFRVHHLAWVSMKGEAKRDFPACIGYQSPWYKEYGLIEDHYSRLNTLMTRGKPVVRIGMIHPIESYWLCFGPWENTKLERLERMDNFDNICKWLLYGLLDFDYISESLLSSLCDLDDVNSKLPVGAMKYDVIIVPAVKTLRKTTLDRLAKFQECGGQVVFMGEIPQFIDAKPSEEGRSLAKKCTTIPVSKSAVYQTLNQYREVDIDFVDPQDTDCLLYTRVKETILYNMRQEGNNRYLFLCNTHTTQSRTNSIITLNGEWDFTAFDTMNGTTFTIPYSVSDGKTKFYWSFPPIGHLVLKLEPARAKIEAAKPLKEAIPFDTVLVEDPVNVSFSERNVLMLDFADYKVDDEEWQGREEVLRVENIVRKKLSIPPKGSAFRQPWCVKDKGIPANTVHLKFEIDSEIDVVDPELVTESLDIQLTFDGKPVEIVKTGYFVDVDIYKIKLPSFEKGKHEIVYSLPFNNFSNIEWLYLLGDFGVKVKGRHATIVAPVTTLAFGDWIHQGLPFYAGNVTYHVRVSTIKFPSPDKEYSTVLRIPEFKAPLINIYVDGVKIGPIALKPFTIDLGDLKSKSEIQIEVFGDRSNAFGYVHNNNPPFTWNPPSAWRTKGDRWTYLYRLWSKGITNLPEIQFYEI